MKIASIPISDMPGAEIKQTFRFVTFSTDRLWENADECERKGKMK